MAQNPLRTELEGVIKRLEDAAYQRGWADAIEHVMVAAKPPHMASARPRSASSARRQHKAGYGAIGIVIESCLDAFDDHGISSVDVVEHGREVFGEDLLESSVRGRLNRMGRRGNLRNERGRWFRFQRPDDAIDQEGEEGDASPIDELYLYRGDMPQPDTWPRRHGRPESQEDGQRQVNLVHNGGEG